MKRFVPFGAAFVLLCVLGFSAHAATITVTTTADETNPSDTPSVSLREAILSINAGADNGADVTANRVGSYGVSDTINFSIPGAGVQTIALASALPTITVPMIINGLSQPLASANTLAVGDNANLLITLDGNSAGAGVSGLTFGTGSTTSVVRGLVIIRFTGSGITNSGSANSLTIAGNFIGVDATGLAHGNAGGGITLANVISGTINNNIIGGTAAADRNVISGNAAGVPAITWWPTSRRYRGWALSLLSLLLACVAFVALKQN